jgi:hypothetical protein
LNTFSIPGHPETRRKFIKQVAGTSAAIAIGPSLLGSTPINQADSTSAAGASGDSINVRLKINGNGYAIDVDTWEDWEKVNG